MGTERRTTNQMDMAGSDLVVVFCGVLCPVVSSLVPPAHGILGESCYLCGQIKLPVAFALLLFPSIPVNHLRPCELALKVMEPHSAFVQSYST